MNKGCPVNTIILFDQSAPAGHSEGPAPNPVDGEPRANVWRCFARPDGTLAAGIWDCSQGSFAIPSHATDEMCSILEGEAVIEHADGTRVTVRPGDSFLIPYGTRTIWHVANYVKKAFVCAVPARS